MTNFETKPDMSKTALVNALLEELEDMHPTVAIAWMEFQTAALKTLRRQLRRGTLLLHAQGHTGIACKVLDHGNQLLLWAADDEVKPNAVDLANYAVLSHLLQQGSLPALRGTREKVNL